MSVGVRAMEIAAGNSNTFTTQAGDNVLVVGIAANPSAGGNITGVTFNGIALTEVVEIGGGAQADRKVWIGYLVAPDIGAFTLVASGTGIDSWTSQVALFVSAGFLEAGQPRDTDAIEDNSNDTLNVSLTPTVAGDLCFYMGYKGGVQASWSGATAETSGVSGSKGAYEIATTTSENASYGVAGDNSIAVCGAAFKAGRSAGRVSGAIG